ncbi:MAG TPA: DUF485 domain-containing protein, partial [Candidatus Baltobacteraceae bacterium]|nr:DUF485 domain-containing protein [Candidatus Baltobacteraceae bacterium]
MQAQHHHISTAQWDALADEPEFRSLVRARRGIIVPATLFLLAFYLGLPISAGFFPQVMSRPALGPLTWAYCYALAQFVMAWGLLVAYLWRARAFDFQ